jgi:hypothetical protein
MMITKLYFGSAPEVWFRSCVEVVERLCLDRGLDESPFEVLESGSPEKRMRAIRSALNGKVKTVTASLADGMSVGIVVTGPKPQLLGMTLTQTAKGYPIETFRAEVAAIAVEVVPSQATLADSTIMDQFQYVPGSLMYRWPLSAAVFDRFHAGSGGFDYWVGDALAAVHGVSPGLISASVGTDRGAIEALQATLRASSTEDLDPFRVARRA